MKRCTLAILAVGFALSMAATASAQVKWGGDGDQAKKDDAAAPAGDLKSDLTPAQYTRAIKPIEAKLALAEKAMLPWEKESKKPEDKRNPKILTACKQQAANMYLAASQAAKQAQRILKDDAQKAAVKTQYEDPNLQKAIDLYLELAAKAHEAGDIRMAVALYRKVLSLDKESSAAKDALVQIDRELKEAKKSGTKSKGGSSEDKKSWDRDDAKNTGRNDGDWSSTGRSSW